MSSATSVLAPVSGKVGEIKVVEGQAVKAGDILIVQHVTKTESIVSAPASGRVKLLVAKGASVNQGDHLASIEP